jgi:hypothetical protein
MPKPQSADEVSMTWYAVVEHIHDRDLAGRACHAVLDLVRSRAARAVIDAYTDHRKGLPTEASTAQEALRALGERQHRRDPGMNIALDLTRREDCDLLRRYAPWSINVDLYDATGDLIANFHDCGHDVSALLTHVQAMQLSDGLAGQLHIEALKGGPSRKSRR